MEQLSILTEASFYGHKSSKDTPKEGLAAREWWIQRESVRASAPLGTTDARLIARAALCFKDQAHYWWHHIVLKGRDSSTDPATVQSDWAAFHAAFKARWLPHEERANRVADLTQPRQGDTEDLQSYIERVHGAVADTIESEKRETVLSYRPRFTPTTFAIKVPSTAAAQPLRAWLDAALRLEGGTPVQDPPTLQCTAENLRLLADMAYSAIQDFSVFDAQATAFLRTSAQVADRAQGDKIRQTARELHLDQDMTITNFTTGLLKKERTLQSLPKTTQEVITAEVDAPNQQGDDPDLQAHLAAAAASFRAARGARGGRGSRGARGNHRGRGATTVGYHQAPRANPQPQSLTREAAGPDIGEDGCLFCGIPDHPTRDCSRLRRHHAGLPATGDPALRRNRRHLPGPAAAEAVQAHAGHQQGN